MLRRIFGLETEFGITFNFRGQRRLSPDEVSRVLFRRVVAWGRSSNVFLENGGRLYLDVGSHPEYATAECDRLVDVVAQEQAGISILNELVHHAQLELQNDGINGSIYLLKNNVDSSGNSYGCHENYCIEREETLDRQESYTIPFLITRQIWSGSGRVVASPTAGTYFTNSQRAEYMWETISSATTRSRPIINSRDEPHADPDRYRRLHVILGDSNMNQFANFVKIGVTSVILSMVEDRSTVLRDYSLAQPMTAIRDVSRDLGDGVPITMANGRVLTALEMQMDMCERALKFIEGREVPEDYQLAIRLWRDLLTDFARDPMSVADRVDWITKHQLIEKMRSSEGLQLNNPRISMLDLMYHDIDPDRGIFYRLAAKGHIRSMVPAAAVMSATTLAPTSTRAHLRGAFVRRAVANHRDFTVDWVHLKLNDQVQRTVMLKDPFQNVDERFDRLLDSL